MSSKASASSLLAVLLCASQIEAHALLADARLGKDKITVEAFFDDDTPAAQALVKVFDSDKKIVAEGKTNSKGFCSLQLPRAGEYQLVVDAGAGHRATEKLVVPPGDRVSDNAEPNQKAAGDTDTRAGADSNRWLKIVIGLSVIAVLSIAYLLSRRLSARTPGSTGVADMPETSIMPR